MIVDKTDAFDLAHTDPPAVVICPPIA